MLSPLRLDGRRIAALAKCQLHVRGRGGQTLHRKTQSRASPFTVRGPAKERSAASRSVVIGLFFLLISDDYRNFACLVLNLGEISQLSKSAPKFRAAFLRSLGITPPRGWRSWNQLDDTGTSQPLTQSQYEVLGELPLFKVPPLFLDVSMSFSRWSNFTQKIIWTFKHGRTRVTLSFPTVLSAPPSESEKCPFNNVNGSHLTAHSFGVES